MGVQRILVLLFPRDAVFLGNIFTRHSHVIAVVDVPEAILDHAVDRDAVAHAESLARRGSR